MSYSGYDMRRNVQGRKIKLIENSYCSLKNNEEALIVPT